MFAERLERVSGRINGTLALSLVAKDGIPVESVSNDPEIDLDLLAAELLAQVRAISQNQRELAVGAVRYFAVATERLTLMVSAVSPDYYLLLVLAAGANEGRARFELRRAALLFEKDVV